MKLKRDKAKPAVTGVGMGSILSARKEELASAMMWVILIAMALLYQGNVPFMMFVLFFFFVYTYFSFNRAIDRATLKTRHLIIDGMVTTVAQSFGDRVIPELKKDGKTIMPALRVYLAASIDGSGIIPAMHQGTGASKRRIFVLVPEYAIENVSGQNIVHLVRNAIVVAYSDAIPGHEISKLPQHIKDALRGFAYPHNLPLDTRQVLVLWVIRADPVPDRIKELVDELTEIGLTSEEIKTVVKGITDTNLVAIVDDYANIIQKLTEKREAVGSHLQVMSGRPPIRTNEPTPQEEDVNE